MVCLGNICRSPLAEGILQEKANNAGLNWIVQSAGTNGFHTGEQPHHLSQKVALMNGIDISNQVACRFTKNDFSKYDRIYAMAKDVMHDMKKIAAEHFDETKVDCISNCRVNEVYINGECVCRYGYNRANAYGDCVRDCASY